MPGLKKLDGLILKAFIGPFILTTAVVVFILLIQQMMQHIDDLLGKGLSYLVFAELLFYFSLHIVPLALPLAVLLSSLITFGNLGEHGELTAVKASGISLIRLLTPVFLLVVLVSVGSFWFNDRVVPEANLRAYSLLWDIRQKSPTLNIKEGAFYDGLPNYSIKINHKYPDGKAIKDIMIYDHSKGRGNKELILADSGRMYTIHQERYLVLELFKGKSYHDQVESRDGNRSTEKFVRNQFEKSQIVFSLAAFDMDTTDVNLFAGHRYMRNFQELQKDVDSLQKQTQKNQENLFYNMKANYSYHFKSFQPSAAEESPQQEVKIITPPRKNKKINPAKSSSKKAPQLSKVALEPKPKDEAIIAQALNRTRNIHAVIKSRRDQMAGMKKQAKEYLIEMYKKFTYALACITMFFIGAPLGAIIKKGGLGVPVLISIVFFIVFYVISITGEKWVKEGFVEVIPGMWMANFLLFIIGIFFLKEARDDSRILEPDFYYVLIDRLKPAYFKWWRRYEKSDII